MKDSNMEMNQAWRYFQPPSTEVGEWMAQYWVWNPERGKGMWIYQDGHIGPSILDLEQGMRGWIEVNPDPDLQMDIGL
jgi:hypothetical protein